MASKEDKPPGFGLPSIDSGELVEVCELFSPAHFYLHRVEERLKDEGGLDDGGEMRKASAPML